MDRGKKKVEPLKQNASGLYIDIQKIGCFYRAACRMAEFKATRVLTIEELNKLWDFSKRIGYINQENNVETSAPIANLAADALKVRGRFTEVATFKDGEMMWYSSVPKNERRADFFIQKIAQNGPSKTHFINVDKYGQEMWDPHEPGIKATGIFYTICYRYEEK